MRLLSTLMAVCLALALGETSAASAAEPSWLCIPAKAGATVTSGGSEGECAAETTALEVPAPAEMKALVQVLPHISYEASGVAEKPTIRFTGVNVQIVNGEGVTTSTNGKGNLVLGYAEPAIGGERTGSHNLLLGTEQEFTSYGGIISGNHNRATGANATVFGRLNTASGANATVLGGQGNTASRKGASVVGGLDNIASGVWASVLGGVENTASEFYATVDGGTSNTASGEVSSVGGGFANTASGRYATVGGGESNIASAEWSWIGGGYKNLIKEEGEYSSIFGGKELIAKEPYEAIP
jgi:hypothetical protein